MTIIFTVFGMMLMIITIPTAGFKTAFKRLMLMIATGFVIDTLTVVLAIGVFHLTV